jgi:hypothetical protein
LAGYSIKVESGAGVLLSAQDVPTNIAYVPTAQFDLGDLISKVRRQVSPN